MVKVTTTEGLELILENEFPCIINFKDKPEIEVEIDSNGKSNEYITSRVTSVLYLSEKLDWSQFHSEVQEKLRINAKNSYDINEIEEDVNYQLSDEGIEFYQYEIFYDRH